MNESLADAAYALTKKHYEAARQAASSELGAQFSNEEFDTVFHAAQRAKKLYFSAADFAERVWAGNFPYEKAINALKSQFSDFPDATVEHAFSDAYTEAR